LRLVAQYADAWNSTGSTDEFARKNAALDGWCERVGRDPAAIERTISVFAEDVPLPLSQYEASGAEHVIRSVRNPFDLGDVAALIAQRG
jgi:hypothetical protein